MRSSHYERLENVLPDPGEVVRAAEQCGRFRSQSEAARDSDADASSTLAALSAAQRRLLGAHGTSFSGGAVGASLERMLTHEAFVDAARRLYGRPIVRPIDLRLGVLLPGQQMEIHTNVPEYRGMNSDTDPDWLLVAMHHSGLFDDWRIAVATAVAWFTAAKDGGEFVFYPDGPFGRSVAIGARNNSAVVFDACTLYHGVDRVAGAARPASGGELRFAGDDCWVLNDGASDSARFASRDLRFSLLWNARCFCDEGEERKVRDHSRDLTRKRVLETLGDGLRRRGSLRAEAADDSAVARAIADAYIKSPPGAPAA